MAKKMHPKCTKGKNLIDLHQFIQYFCKQYTLYKERRNRGRNFLKYI